MAEESAKAVRLGSLHEAQAFEDARTGDLSLDHQLLFPLETRTEETQQVETWDDVVNLDEIEQASRTLASLNLSGNGTPTCLAVDSKLVFVGLSNASILLFDHFGVSRGQLQTTVEAQAVTSIDSYQNALVLAGYADGRIVLWDASQSVRLLEAVGPTGTPMVSLRWYRGGVSCIAIDASGVANLLRFSKTFLLNSYSAEKKLLLDGRSKDGFGPIFASRVLNTDASVGLALAVSGVTIIVRLEPEPVRVSDRWPCAAFVPDRTSSSIPCLAYHPSAFFGRRSSNPVLARCFQRTIEFACLDQMLDRIDQQIFPVTIDSDAVACEWISESCLAILDANYQFRMVDAQASMIVGTCDATQVQLVQWYFPSHPDIAAYSESIRALKWTDEANATVYMLGMGELVKMGVQPWNLRVDRLVRSGQWLEAMTLSLKYYRTVLRKLETREDVRTAGLVNALKDGSRIADLLKNFLMFHQNNNSLSFDVAAICIEYSLAINRPDLVFEDVFGTFLDANKSEDYVSVLAPFVASGKVTTTIPPLIFDQIVQWVASHASKQTLEMLFLSLPSPPADLDGSIRVCKERRLFSGLCRLYNQGLLDFVTPVQVALQWMTTNSDEFGYRLLLYLSYCFLGMEYPKGTVPLPPDVCDSARTSLLAFLFPLGDDVKAASNPQALKSLLAFDANETLKAVEQAGQVVDSPQVFRWLIHTGLELPEDDVKRAIVFEFVIRHLSTFRPRQVDPTSQTCPLEELLTPALAEALFKEVYTKQNEDTTLAFVEHHPDCSGWFLQQLALMEDPTINVAPTLQRKRLLLIAVLSRVNLRTYPGEFTFGDAMDAYLNLNDETRLIEFLREQRDRLGHTDYFSRIVASRARRLLQVNSEGAARLLLDLNVNVDTLVRNLDGDPTLQYALLSPLVGAKAFGEQITSYMVETFIKLLCEREPQNAMDWLSKNEGWYPLELALEVCRSHGIEDAIAYLLERAGRVDEALELVLKKPAMGTHQFEQRASAAIKLCTSLSQDQASADAWFRVLETFLNHAEALPPESDAVRRKVIGLLVDAMLPFVPLDMISDRVRAWSTKKSLPAVECVLECLNRQAFLYKTALKSLKQDQVGISLRQRAHRVRGARIRKSALASVRVEFLPDKHSGFNSPSHFRSVQERSSDFDAQEACWNALLDADPTKLSDALVKGTPYELRLYNPNAFEAHFPELANAGLFDE